MKTSERALAISGPQPHPGTQNTAAKTDKEVLQAFFSDLKPNYQHSRSVVCGSGTQRS